MVKCTIEKLNMFSHKFNTYINQIFGDETVRDILSKSENKLFIDGAELHVIRQPTEFVDNENSVHHITKIYGRRCKEMQPIYQTNIKGKVISNIENNDIYCQTYSLMRAYGIHIPKNVYHKQMAMIQMYRDILSNKRLMRELYNKIDVTSWLDTTVTPNEPFETYDLRSKIPRGIIDTLNDWENFGYLRAIGNGKCPTQINNIYRTHTVRNIGNRTINRSRRNGTRSRSRSRNRNNRTKNK